VISIGGVFAQSGSGRAIPNFSYIDYSGRRSGSAAEKKIFSIRSFSPKEM